MTWYSVKHTDKFTFTFAMSVILLFVVWVYYINKGKVISVHFLTEHHAMKAYWGSGGIAPRIL
jgi:hypothetical protein